MTDETTVKVAKLSGGRFLQSDYSIGRYAARPVAGTTIDDVLHPEFFQNELNVLRPGMEINVLSDDFALDCDLRVLTVTKTTAKCRLIRLFREEDAPKASADISGIDINWGGPNHKWRYVHNGTVIEHGFATQDEALEAAAAYEKKMKG